MNEKTANQIIEMKKQTIGVEVEMNVSFIYFRKYCNT